MTNEFVEDMEQELPSLIELNLAEKDQKGVPTGRRKSLISHSGYEIWKFWNQNQPRKKKGKSNLVAKDKNKKSK